MKKTFYEIAERLDYLSDIEIVSPKDLTELLSHIQNEEYARYFFNELENPVWVPHLHSTGYFLEVPPPEEDPENPGYYAVPGWPAGEYLTMMADRYPEIVKDVALNLDSDNSRAIRTILAAIRRIPSELAAETVDSFEKWAETPFVKMMSISYEMSSVLDQLAKDDQWNAALQVFSILLDPREEEDPIAEGKTVAGTRFDTFWLEKGLHENTATLLENQPFGCVKVIKNKLIKATSFEIDPRIDSEDRARARYWRLSIDPASQLGHQRDIKNILVNLAIDTLEMACKKDPEEARKLLLEFIQSEYTILRRIAVFTLREWGELFTDLLELAYQQHAESPIRGAQSEFEDLIADQFANLPEDIRKDLLGEIRNGPESEWVEDLLNEYPDRFKGATREEKRESLIEEWQWREYGKISEALDGEDLARFERLKSKFGKPVSRAAEGAFTSWTGPESPIELAELSLMSIDEVAAYLPSFSAPEGPFAPSKEGLGRTLEEDVQSRPVLYSENASLFASDAIEPVYLDHLMRGLRNSIGQEDIDWGPVINLCEYVCAQPMEYDKEVFVTGWSHSRLAVAKLLEELLRGRKYQFDQKRLGRIFRIIKLLLEGDDPFLAEENGTNLDPATRSLNCIRGIALHATVWFALFVDHIERDEESPEHRFFHPSAQEILQEYLDKSVEPTLTVHSVYGWHFPRFVYLDEQWATERLDKIFPVQIGGDEYFKAAWEAYIRFSDVYSDVFPLLRDRYLLAIERLSDMEREQGFDRIDEKLASHVLKAYLLDLIQLDSSDGILSLYFQSVSDETRAHGNFWLSKVLEAQEPSKDDPVWERIWQLWKQRFQVIRSSPDPSAFSKEVTSYSRLLMVAPLSLEEAYPVIGQLLDFEPGGFETSKIIEYLRKHSDHHPEKALQLLHQIVLSEYQTYMTSETRNHIERILENANNLGSGARELVAEIVNFYGKQGDYEWRKLLSEAGN